MIRIVFTFLMIVVFLQLYVFLPEGVIRGRVFDSVTGNGLQGASIIFKSNSGIVAGINGTFFLKTNPGNISVTFNHIGYKTVTRMVKLADNDTVFLNIGLETDIAEIDPVVVSAGRIEQRISELSVSMMLIKPDAINKNHITDTKELLTKTSGIEVMDGQASVRGGSGFSYGAGSRVLALIDGLPVMAADAGNIKWSYLPLENISQIEIIKGASSVAYGSSALNGVINFRTADATAKPVTNFYAESGIYGSPSNKNWKW